MFQGQLSTSGPYFPVYMILLAAYVLPRLCIFAVLCITPYRKWASRVGNNKFVQFVKIFYQVRVPAPPLCRTLPCTLVGPSVSCSRHHASSV